MPTGDPPSVVKLELDVPSFDAGAWRHAIEHCERLGIQFCNLAELGDTETNRRRLYELNKICSADIPGRGPFYSYEQYCELRVQTDSYTPAGVILARIGDAWIGMSAASHLKGQDYVFNEMTGVLREYRRQGIATALKVLSIQFARSLGVRKIYTVHAAENLSAIAMNRHLGYVDRMPHNSHHNTPLEKVTAFVTRGMGHAQELLVFRHPNGSVQLPAGTVEENEYVVDAVMREVYEETGLTSVEIVKELGAEPQIIPANGCVVLRKVRLQVAPEPDAQEVKAPFPTFLGFRRGLYIRQIGESSDAKYAQVAYDEFDGPAHHTAIPSRSITGWVEADSITPAVIRHFFHLTPTAPVPNTWTQCAEEWEYNFELFWTPMPDALEQVDQTGLITYQAEWLSKFVDTLRSGVGS